VSQVQELSSGPWVVYRVRYISHAKIGDIPMDYGNIIYVLAGVTLIGAIAGAAFTLFRTQKAIEDEDK
jgi:hypothetical protein